MNNLFKRSNIIVKSYAKINLSLKVLGKRQDGYHDMEMVMVPLEMHDTIEINRFNEGSNISVSCDDLGLASMQNNLCYKSIAGLRSIYHFEDSFELRIYKRIPFCAGLGGGSSNAAAVIVAVCKMLKLDYTSKEVLDLAVKIGADVPFFLMCKPAIATGIGEKLQEINVKNKYKCLIVKPEEGLSTKDVFSICDDYPKTATKTQDVVRALETGDEELLANSVDNDLYAPACQILPKIKDIVEDLKANGLPVSMMTGSGSAVFSLSDDVKKLETLADKYSSIGYYASVTKIL